MTAGGQDGLRGRDENPVPLVTVEIDGHKLQVEAGRNMLDVALSNGFDLPFFCWHPLMGSIGACRQCAVRLSWANREGNEKTEIAMACMTEAQEGTRIAIDDAEAIRFRAAVIELMMMSHPHDCPVCDEGGECHLQDMTVMTGHAQRRYRGPKRTFENQDLGPFVTHEPNRCITCYRCTRFYNDYAGGHDFSVFGLRDQVFFGRHADGTLESEFSGNLVEVCPTGVFTDKTFRRRYSRKWDLQTAPSVCPHCGLGCTVQPGERDGVLRRVLSRFNPQINRMFLCDRGRFGYEFVNAADRIREPVLSEIVRRPAGASGGQHPEIFAVPAVRRLTDGQALGYAVSWLRMGRPIGIGSPRASLEANHALRTLVGADRFFLGMSDADHDLVGLALDIARDPRTHAAALAGVQEADAAFILGEDVTNSAPMLDLTLRTWLHLRPTAAEERVQISRWSDAAIGRFKQVEPSALWIATSFATRLDEVAADAWRATPDDLVRLTMTLVRAVEPASGKPVDVSDDDQTRVARWAEALATARSPLIVCGTSSGSRDLLRAAAELAWALPGARILLTVPEPNSMGLRMIGGERLSEAFAAVARGDADTVVVLENDLYRRAPALQVDDFLARAGHIVSIDYLLNDTSGEADLVLPSATYAESTGTFVNNEGRAQRFSRVFQGQGETRAAWHWLREMLAWLERPEGPAWETVDDVVEALEREVPGLRGVSDAAPATTPAPKTRSPGWNSVSGLHKLQEEAGGQLRDVPPGVRLIAAGSEPPTWPAVAVPKRAATAGDRWQIVPASHIFGSDDLSMHAPGVAQRAPELYLALNDADAARLEVSEGDWLMAWLPWLDIRAPFRRLPSLPDGIAAMPVGLAESPYVALPHSARLQRLEGAPTGWRWRPRRRVASGGGEA